MSDGHSPSKLSDSDQQQTHGEEKETEAEWYLLDTLPSPSNSQFSDFQNFVQFSF